MGREPASRVEDLELCAHCRGRCCKESPGRFAPSDFEGDQEFDTQKLDALLKEGVASITVGFVSALNSQLAPIFMPKHRGKGKGELEFFCSEVNCDALTKQGCPYPLSERPFECAAIIPSATKCSLPEGLEMEDLWAPYQSILYTLINQYAGHDWVEEFTRQLDDKNGTSPFKREIQGLIKEYGLTTSASEIALIADIARSI
ncbi:MAG: hypothetical protein FWF91_06805 [Coriobacteriia bacterium]|nr:hypothetical protein [Coriobacteriia bacterium]